MRPETEAELAEMVAGLAQPVRIAGGGTRGVTGPDADLSVTGLRGITLYEPGALTLVARAGTSVADINAALDAEGQRLAFEPMDHRALMGTTGEPTIGGVVAANVSGPRRVQAGACRDFLLGVRYVDGLGQVIRNGGRVMKNVTGYDLVKLLAGSWGTLGVLTEVSLKVLPRSESSATLVWSGCDWSQSLKLFSEALASPFEVTGAARLPGGSQMKQTTSETVIRIEGFSDSVAYRIGKLTEMFCDQKPDRIVTDAAENEAIWKAVRDVEPFADTAGNVWKTSVKPTDMLRVVDKPGCTHLLDWGGGLIWTLAPEGFDLRAALEGVPGHSTLVRGRDAEIAQFGRFQPEPAGVAALTQGLRQRFDPKGLFNPGLMG